MYLATTDVLARKGVKQTGRFLVVNAENELLKGKTIPVNTDKTNIRVATYELKATGTATIQGVQHLKYNVILETTAGPIKIKHSLKTKLVQHFKPVHV